jgi:hypothetical protein
MFDHVLEFNNVAYNFIKCLDNAQIASNQGWFSLQQRTRVRTVAMFSSLSFPSVVSVLFGSMDAKGVSGLRFLLTVLQLRDSSIDSSWCLSIPGWTILFWVVTRISFLSLLILLSLDSAVVIASGYGLDDRGVGFRLPVESRIFLFSTSSSPALGPTQPPIQWVQGALSSRVKRQGREADHSPPTSAGVKKIRIYTSTYPCAFMA